MYISVIVPYKDGEKYIERFMEGVLSQSIANEKFEIVFVDNLSLDTTREIISKYVKRHNLSNIRIEKYDEKPSSYAARNYGVKCVKGDILVFTDIDCRMDSEFLLNISNYLIKEPNVPIAGKIVIEIEDLNNCWEVYDAHFNMDNKRMLERDRIATANFALSKRLFENFGEFTELISSGDSEYGERLKKNNVNTHYKENVIVFHPSRKSFKDIEKKLLRIAYGEGQRARIDNKNLFKMRIIYFLKAFNLINIKRLWMRMKGKVSLFNFIPFTISFTKIRIKQAQAFSKGFSNNDIRQYNK